MILRLHARNSPAGDPAHPRAQRGAAPAYLERVDRWPRARAAPTAWAAPTWRTPSPALPANDKLRVVAERAPNIGIVTAYNDMLSAHAPYEGYPGR